MPRTNPSPVVLLALVGGCAFAPPPSTTGPSAAAESRPETPSAAAGKPSEERSFGAPLDAAWPEVPLSELLANPDRYRDRPIRTSGRIARVCQRMGCWMELASGDGRAVRAPMSGHAFFLPRDVAGREARVAGHVRLAELSPETRAHLESEGAEETTSRVSLEATGVVVR
ncbi:MAG: DUF4920 domain-containing protein [Polyangiales bacterium]